MAKRIKSKMKDGETLTGEIDSLENNQLVLKDANGSEIQLRVDDNLQAALEEQSYGDIVKITCEGDEFTVEELDEFPADEKTEKK